MPESPSFVRTGDGRLGCVVRDPGDDQVGQLASIDVPWLTSCGQRHTGELAAGSGCRVAQSHHHTNLLVAYPCPLNHTPHSLLRSASARLMTSHTRRLTALRAAILAVVCYYSSAYAWHTVLLEASMYHAATTHDPTARTITANIGWQGPWPTGFDTRVDN